MKKNILGLILSCLVTSQAFAWGSYSYASNCKSKSVIARLAVSCAEADGCDTEVLSLKVNGKIQDLNRYTISSDSIIGTTYRPAGLILVVNKETSDSVTLIFDGYSLSESGKVIVKSSKNIYNSHPHTESNGKTETLKCQQTELTAAEHESMGY